MNIREWISLHTRHLLVSWRDLSKNWIIGLVNKFVLLTLIGSVVLILVRWPMLPPLVPLWYSRPWGADQLAHPAWLFMLPLGSMFWYLTNTIVAAYVTSEYLVFTQTLFLTSLVTSFLSFITLIKILFIVT
jgi:hypothetical protein